MCLFFTLLSHLKRASRIDVTARVYFTFAVCYLLLFECCPLKRDQRKRMLQVNIYMKCAFILFVCLFLLFAELDTPPVLTSFCKISWSTWEKTSGVVTSVGLHNIVIWCAFWPTVDIFSTYSVKVWAHPCSIISPSLFPWWTRLLFEVLLGFHVVFV